MKRRFIAAALALMLLSLTGCVERTGDEEGEWRPDPDHSGTGLLDWMSEGSNDPDRYWAVYTD